MQQASAALFSPIGPNTNIYINIIKLREGVLAGYTSNDYRA